MKQQTLSRAAERIYWLGRYMERAESTARLINVNANLLIDTPVRLPLGWQPLIDITGARELFAEHFDEATERNVVRFLLHDQRNSGSVINSLTNARENARTVREIIPRRAFEIVNELYLFARQSSGVTSRSRLQDVVEGLAARVQQLDGFLSANMIHDAKWDFLRLGQHIERADMTTRIIDVRSADLLKQDRPDLQPYEDVQWRSVLRSLYALQSYYATQNVEVSQGPALEFLLTHPALPRSYVRCITAVRNSLRSLPRNERPLRSCNRMLKQLKQVDVAELEGEALHKFTDDRQIELATLHNDIARTYFHYRPRRESPQATQRQAKN